jgi:hypothetical protein
MHITEDRGRIVEVGGVEPGESKTPVPQGETLPTEKFVAEAKGIVKTGLEQTGLTHAESEAMVEIWVHSYSRATGCRVLWILPRQWTKHAAYQVRRMCLK